MKKQEDSQKIDFGTKSSLRRKLSWLVLLLIPLSLLIPLGGELLRNELIGAEYVCCMPENYEEKWRQAEQAREKRGLSNTIIIGSDLLGIAALVSGCVIFVNNIVMTAEWSLRKKITVTLIVGAVGGLFLFVVGYFTLEYVLDTSGYYTYEQPYYGGLYTWLFGL